jgi:heme oxygenase
MSMVLERAQETRNRLAPKLTIELEKKPLSRLLRRDSWPDHERAQFGPFEMALATGRITMPAYLDLLYEVHAVYVALEARAETLADDPLVMTVLHPGLRRQEAVAADIEFFEKQLGGSKRQELLDVTKDFVARIESVDPVRYIAHHYNRYLADLSGGAIIAAAIKQALKLDVDGLRYYDFSAGIPDANEFKADYRDALDKLPLDVEGKLELIEEVMAAYEFNIEMTNVLAERHGITG